jgi:hypothetical protein
MHGKKGIITVHIVAVLINESVKKVRRSLVEIRRKK